MANARIYGMKTAYKPDRKTDRLFQKYSDRRRRMISEANKEIERMSKRMLLDTKKGNGG